MNFEIVFLAEEPGGTMDPNETCEVVRLEHSPPGVLPDEFDT
jgi:hypothetical protein